MCSVVRCGIGQGRGEKLLPTEEDGSGCVMRSAKII